jgi:nucleotide-binding universal stress UspA family protein
MFEQVVVPFDGSDHADRALFAARLVAEALAVPVVLVQATHPDDLDRATTDLRERALQLEAPDAELVLDSVNDAVGAIVEAVRARPNSLVCMSTHGRGGLGRALFGSVTEGALTEAEAPFLLVGPHADLENLSLGDVLVPLDGSHRAESILPVVTEWARATGGSLWLVEVVDPKAAAKVEASGEDIAEGAYVERIAEGLPDDLTGVEWDVLHGKNPAAAICEHAAEHDLPIVALATHGHSGLSRLVAGSVSTRVAHDHTGVTLVIRTADPED